MTSFEGRTVAITGASRGIGEAAARHFAAKGAHVVLAARSAGRIEEIAAEIRAEGGRAAAVACDVADAGAVEALIAAAVDEGGGLDVLVNNAGVIDPIAHLAESDPAGWDAAVDVNLKGVYHGMRFALPVMLAAGGGTIVNISSGAAVNPMEGWSHYCATKAAVLMLTRSADLEYRDKGVRVVGLSPGTVATDMQRSIRASGINPISQMEFSSHIPPEWVARAIEHLCTPAADRHLGADFSLKTPEGRAEVGLPKAG